MMVQLVSFVVHRKFMSGGPRGELKREPPSRADQVRDPRTIKDYQRHMPCRHSDRGLKGVILFL